MKNIKLALIYFLLAYLIGTVVSLATYYVNVIVMWIAMFTLIPAIFGYFFYLYLKNTKCDLKSSLKETNLLMVLWIVASLLLDGCVYVIIVSLLSGLEINWFFFADQSPWIYLNYGTIIIAGYIGRYFYIRSLNKSQKLR